MRIVQPQLIKEFECIGGSCPDTCCAGWNISIDEATDRYYQSVDGEFGKLLDEKINREDTPSRFILDENLRCPFLRPDNLCAIYRTLGPDKLSETCTQFPRGHLKINDLKFSYLSFGCPEIIRMVFEEEDPLVIELTDDGQTTSDGSTAQDSYSLTDFYLDSFIAGVDILQDRSFSIRQRLALAILFYEQQQTILDNFGPHLDDPLPPFAEPIRPRQIVTIQRFARFHSLT